MKRLALVVLAACGGSKPPGSWVERESHAGPSIGESHVESGGEHATPVAIPFDPAKLTEAQIDELDEATVRAAIDRLNDAAPSARLAVRGARLAHHRGDDAVARAFAARAASAADQASVKAELDAIARAIAAPHIDPKTIAVLLPLSGRFSSIGAELKAAIQLAPAEGAAWLFLDTKGEPDAAAAAVEQAFSRGAVAILGPVGEREAIAAARAAALRQLPIALLAPADGADASAGVFRVVESPADEGRAVARIAAEDSFGTVGVFAPRDDVGQEAADAFVAEAKQLGLQVTAQGTYDPTGGNLEPDVKTFLNLVPATNPRFAEHLRRAGKKAWTTFSPDVPYSLLYLPDRYDRAAIVAAFLPYFGVELRTQEFMDPTKLQRKHAGSIPQVVQLIGGAGWHHPSLPIRGGAAMQGALFVDAFAGDLGADTGAQFAQVFQQRTSRTPTAAAAQAHDAAWLVARVRKETAYGPEPRGAFRAAMARAKLDDGACGPATMGADGELVRSPSVLEVSGDQLIVAP